MYKRYLCFFLIMTIFLTLSSCAELKDEDFSENPAVSDEQEQGGEPVVEEPNDQDLAAESKELPGLEKVELSYSLPKEIPDDDFEAFDQNLKALYTMDMNQTRFGDEVIEANPELEDSNYVYSPLSTWLCYELFLGGVSGEVEADLRAHLESMPFPDEQQKLDAIERLIAKYNEEESATKISNYLFITKEYDFNKVYLEYAKSFFPGLYRMDLLGDAETVTSSINELVRRETLDLIPEFYKETLDQSLLSILMNIVAMDVSWLEPFDPENTEEAKFTKADGSVIDVQMMEQISEDDMSYLEDDFGQYLLKPYGTGEMMLLMLPHEGRTAAEILAHWRESEYTISRLEAYEVHLKLPKFSIETTHPLKDIFLQLGLGKLFDPSYGSDMQGIVDGKAVFISDSKQVAKIEVFEEGTKAAAVTAAELEGVSIAPELKRVEISFDRPFAFIIFDQELELFRGVVQEPRQ